MCSTGSPEAFWMRSIRSRRSQPECVAGCVETMISSGRRSAIASIVARKGSASPTSPVASMPSSASSRDREVDAHLRRFAHRLVVDHEARRGLALGHHQAKAHVAGRRALAHARRAASRRRACGWPPPGSPSSDPPPLLIALGAPHDARPPALRPPAGGRRGREDAVHRARDAVLVGAAHDRGHPVEVEDRRRRGDLPLERHAAPRVGHARAGRRASW